MLLVRLHYRYPPAIFFTHWNTRVPQADIYYSPRTTHLTYLTTLPSPISLCSCLLPQHAAQYAITLLSENVKYGHGSVRSLLVVVPAPDPFPSLDSDSEFESAESGESTSCETLGRYGHGISLQRLRHQQRWRRVARWHIFLEKGGDEVFWDDFLWIVVGW